MDAGSAGLYICLFIALYFEVFLLISFFEKKPSKKDSALPSRYPSVTVLVPCWNKAATLSGTVESLLALDYPKEKLSIMIIDDGSTDNTYEVARRYAEHPQISVYKKENEGSKYAALNFGIAHSDSELVGCLDADSFVVKDALIEVVKKFESDPALYAVTPAMVVNEPRTILERMQSVEYTFGVFWRKMFDQLNAISVLPGPFSFYRRAAFAIVGPFRKAHHTEDMEMAFRFHAHGLKIGNAHHALVSTNVPRTVPALIRQRTRWSRGFLENSRDYWYMYFNRKFGNFGMLVLPFGLVAFFAGLYTASYALYTAASTLSVRLLDWYTTGIPLRWPHAELSWFYLNTATSMFVVAAVLLLTLAAVLIGSHIVESRPSARSLLVYFAFFGLIAPLWLVRATWDTILSRDRGWLV